MSHGRQGYIARGSSAGAVIFEGGDTPLSHFVAAQAATKEKNSQPWPALAVAVEVGQRFVAELIKVSAVDRGADVV